ncbi:MAG TPA: DUF2865 domain-containing protein [Hyphomicrobium sp.]|nr:DUF2865 domain-containing protein [Hyphomicrobium sp.]
MRKAHARRQALGAAILAAAVMAACPALAQGWWPWSSSEPERPPVPDEPVYREPPPMQGERPTYQPRPEPAPGAQMPPPQAAPSVNWSTKNPICLQLEQRLVQDGQRSSGMRDRLPGIEAEMDKVEQAYEQSQADLERSDCYEYFLFSKTLRRSRRCVDLAQQRDQAQRRLADLDAQRQQIANSGVRSYREEIVRELARNNCGANYTQEARRYDRGSDSSSIWQDEDEGGNFSNNWTPFGGHSSATYRTVCVRLCDGYYFPVSFSTLPSHFEQDAEACQSRCAAPAELYYYQNPGSAMDQSIAFRTQEPYTSLKTAFRYRKELVKGCSCKEAEYVAPDAPAGDSGRRAETGAPRSATTGWEARSEAEAQRQQ